MSLLVLAGLALTVFAIGCGSDDNNSGDTSGALTEVGPGEGQLNLVNWPGYVADPWKADFEKESGCKVSTTETGTSAEMVDKLQGRLRRDLGIGQRFAAAGCRR